MLKKEICEIIYKNAYDILLNEIGKHDLELHLENDSKFNDINTITYRLISSAQNRQMMPNVIKFHKNEEAMKNILFNFSHNNILNTYKNSELLLNIFKKKFSSAKISNEKRNLWFQFSESIFSICNFMSNFKDEKEFNNFVKSFNFNKYTKASLPMLLSTEIKGFRFALACDFLKELGYREYPKPDIHLIDIFYELKLSESRDPYDVYKNIVEFSEIINIDAYSVDKIFWLLSSGDFYRINKTMKSKKKEFIEMMKNKLSIN